MSQSADDRLDAFANLLRIVDRLRDPGGCPWDRDQTLEATAPHVLEEAYEVADAMARGDRGVIAGELGDLLMNVLLACRIAQDAGAFSLKDAAAAIADKLVRRHPHVFGEVKVEGVEQVLANWEEIKRAERAQDVDPSVLAGVPAALPALLRAFRMGEKAARVGFRWQDGHGAWAKLDEELGELKAALASNEIDRVDEEIGDVLFSVVNVARHAGVNPETALRRAGTRFSERFRVLERELGASMKGRSEAELAERYRAAKRVVDPDLRALPPHAPVEWLEPVRQAARERRLLLDQVRDLPTDLLGKAPQDGGWSMLQVVEHVGLVEARVAHGLRTGFAALAAAGPIAPFPPEGLAAYPPKNRLHEPIERVNAPERVLPSATVDRGQAFAALEAARVGVFERLPELVRIHPRALTLPHPYFGDLDVLQWFEFLAMHDRVHRGQILRLRAAFAKDGS
ncbi:MAG: nucleoside triphosphate pyrophosphohydrolase [Planctomycetes bacterium]|nr:nucleoside triphosphate pyrophosphohydrolase [Planctomycetota bacterium]